LRSSRRCSKSRRQTCLNLIESVRPDLRSHQQASG
jgi:hypothetical protein